MGPAAYSIEGRNDWKEVSRKGTSSPFKHLSVDFSWGGAVSTYSLLNRIPMALERMSGPSGVLGTKYLSESIRASSKGLSDHWKDFADFSGHWTRPLVLTAVTFPGGPIITKGMVMACLAAAGCGDTMYYAASWPAD